MQGEGQKKILSFRPPDSIVSIEDMEPTLQHDRTAVASSEPKYMLCGELRQARKLPNRMIRG
jgi:hypothetical protein